jgi:cobalt-zinc-cadmium efflux system outer membrane protein
MWKACLSCLLLFKIVAAAGAAFGQAAAPAIDEAQLVAELEANDVRRAVVAAKVAAARADVAAAQVRGNPSLSIEREEPFADSTGLPTNYLRLTVPFDVSGSRGRRIAAAETGVRAATRDAARGHFELIVDGLRAFDDAAHARMQVEILTVARESLVRAVEIARQRSKAGAASGYEVQRFELELEGHDDELASAQIELRRARARLAASIGRTGELDARATLELPAAVPALDALLSKAAGRDDLRAAQLRGEAATGRAGAADRGWVPAPSLTAGAMTADLGDRTGTGYVAGLALAVPIFDRGQSDRAKAVADRQVADAEARWLARHIPSAVHTAHATLLARIEQARRITAGQLDRLDLILRAAETAFREGNASVVELLDAHRAARAVRLRALELRHHVARDKRELELAVGQRL